MMFTSLTISGYRGLERFEMSDLGRINLLVGTNNSGKTSVLEAIHLLASRGDPMALWQLLWRRGEKLTIPFAVASQDRPLRRSQTEIDVCHLFHGHEITPLAEFRISAENNSMGRRLEFSVVEATPDDQPELFDAEGEAPLFSRMMIKIDGSPKPQISQLPISRYGGVSLDFVEAPNRMLRRRQVQAAPAQFITTESLGADELMSLWDNVTLTPSEDLVLQALRFLEPSIERVAAQTASMPTLRSAGRGGFIVKLKGVEQPVPIGSMGDGMWRMLAMAIALTQCQGGVLLVDEIDTGLHHTVMANMWRLVFLAARELDVQVFATTHSNDCVFSLATLCQETDSENKVTVQRIEPHRLRAVPYSQTEIRIAAERNIEVR
ncbi:MAG: AAA family ATPase [Acidobacteria bacterium]|nr:AAA family ATPase [Acidobacteriota bacterium]